VVDQRIRERHTGGASPHHQIVSFDCDRHGSTKPRAMRSGPLIEPSSARALDQRQNGPVVFLIREQPCRTLFRRHCRVPVRSGLASDLAR
jgi:hypothetical protein